MLTLTSVGLLLLTLVAFTRAAESSEQASVNGSLACAPSQTACALGCCPYTDAVCCADGYECCQHGQICLSYIGICINVENKKKEKAALVSDQETPLQEVFAPCPSGTTTCGPNKCCPFPNANCCSDQNHCCPYGYRCDLIHQRCVRYSSNDLDSYIPFVDGGKTSMPQKNAFINKPSHKSCPGDYRQCPSYTSCCLNDKGDWSCCPNPSINMVNKGGNNECCSTVYGYVCCPDAAPHCTYWGCTL